MKIQFLNRGFTLVELMVVISIIGILASIVYVNFADSKKIARDEIRKTTLKDLQLAINLYKAQNGVYPDGCKGSGVWGGTSAGDYFKCSPNSDPYIKRLVPDFISTLPYDSVYPSSNAGYIYKSDGVNYKLMSHNAVEKKTITDSSQDFARCPDFTACGGNASDQLKTYAVYSAGAANW